MAGMFRSKPRARALALCLAPLLGLWSASTVLGAGPVKISSDPYTNSTSNHKTQVEPDTFAWGTTVVSVFQSGRFFDGGASNIGYATSTDGGSTWTQGFLPSSTVFATPPGRYPRASDPSVAFDAKHNVWMVSWLGLFPGGNTSRVDVLVSRSTDGGLTFGAPVAVQIGQNNDKNWSVCDDTATSPFYGNCYTEFDNFGNLNRFEMSTSSDGGLTWGAEASTPDHTCVIGGQPLVQPNGRVVVPIDDCSQTNLLSIVSNDGGATWNKPVLAAQELYDFHPGNIRSPDLPSAEIDKSGRVYAVWYDCRFESSCNTGSNDLLLTTSDDGVNWTLPRRIPTAAVGTTEDFLLPGIGVDRSTQGSSAHIGVIYYYFSNVNCTNSSCRLNVGFISSTNGGSNWSAGTHVAGPMVLTWAPLTTQGYMVGDYMSTSIVAGSTTATPAFMLASPPATPPSCSDPSTGAPGQDCQQPTFTDLLTVSGGTHRGGVGTSGAASGSSRPSSPVSAR